MIDHHGSILEFNPAAERVFGYARAEVLGKDIAETIIPPSLRNQHRSGLTKYLATGVGPVLGKRIEITGMRADGTEFPVELVVTPVPGEVPPVFIGFLRDITERMGAGEALKRRARQFEAIAQVARVVASIQELDTLLPLVTEVINQQFGFYHVGIFLVDETRQYAVLQAANSEGGGRMLARQHQLRLDSNSIVGYATSRGEPRIALDVGVDAVYFNNPDLPDTRSEMALPLQAGKRTIGALDVQSTDTNAFSQEDISVLATLADQVAIAIENARLFGEARSALSKSQNTMEKYVKQAWGSFSQQMKHTGFVFDGKQVVPLEKGARREQIKAAMETGKLSLERATSTMAIPIRLRGQTIGVLDVRSKSGQREWTRDEISMLKAAAERAALALENARLVDSAQRRAARERTIGEIAARIGTASNVDAILQTAVEELGRKISGAAEVTLELSSPKIEQDVR